MQINWAAMGEVDAAAAGVVVARLAEIARRANGLRRVSFIDRTRGCAPEVKLATSFARGSLGVVRTGETREAALLATVDGLECLLRSRSSAD